jgi:hypothetical protein
MVLKELSPGIFMQLETRCCIEPGCKRTFKCLPTSQQTGCCRNHDKAGQEFKNRFSLRRKKNKDFDSETGVELVDVTDEI